MVTGYNSGVNDGWNDVCQAGYIAKITGGEYNPWSTKYSGKATHGVDSSCNGYRCGVLQRCDRASICVDALFFSDTFMKGYSKGYEGELSAHQQSIYDTCFKSKAAAAPAKASPLFKPKGS